MVEHFGYGFPSRRFMKNDFTCDPEPLQRLFASAFAAQESGINSERRAVIAEIQRLIGDGALSLDGAIQLIAEEARSVADASGTAIGLLKKDRLVYAAGTGSGVTYVGRRVMATLSGSAPQGAMAEILRVENADADARIQSEICRQFGAKSLLILPIYFERELSGVLQIFFSQAHQFADQELRAYRTFAGLVGEAMSLSSHPEPKAAPATRLSGGNRLIEHEPAPVGELLSRKASMAGINEQPVDMPRRTSVAEIVGTQTIRQTGEPFATWMRTIGLPIFRHACDVGIAAAILMAMVSFLLYGDHSSRMSRLAGSASGVPSSVERQITSASTQPVGHVSANDSVGRDAMRRSRPASSKWPSRSASKVAYFGDDVTIRYFAPRSAVMQAGAGETEVRRVFDDVSVRHFKPRN